MTGIIILLAFLVGIPIGILRAYVVCWGFTAFITPWLGVAAPSVAIMYGVLVLISLLRPTGTSNPSKEEAIRELIQGLVTNAGVTLILWFVMLVVTFFI